MFTFSFSTAFATATYTDKDVYLADVAAAEVTATEQLEAQFNVLKATVKADKKYQVSSYDVTADAWEVALSMLYTDMKTAITARTNALVSAGDWNSRETAVAVSDYTGVSSTAINGKLDTAANMKTTLTTTEKYMYAAAKKQAELDKAEYLAGAAAIDTTIYSTTEGAADAYKLAVTKQYNNAKAYADALIADLTAKMGKDNVNVVYSDATSANVASKGLAMKALFEDVVSYNETTKVYSLLESGDYTVYGAATTDFYIANSNSAARLDIKTIKEENLANQSSAYKIQTNVSAAYQTVFAAEYNGETQNADAIAKWQELADAYTATQTYLAKATPDAFPSYTITYNKTTKVYTLTESDTKYVANAKAVTDTTALVDSLKASGKYDNTALDTALKTFKNTAYTGAVSNTQVAALSTSSNEIKACLKSEMETFDKERAKYELSELVDADNYTIEFTPAYNATTLTGANSVYYAKEWADVEAAVQAAYDAIDAAALTTDITAAKKALNNALYAIKTASAVDTAVAADSAMGTALTYASKEVKAYYDSLVAGKNADDVIATTLYNATESTMLDNIKAKIVAEGARTAADVPTVAAAVKAEMAATPTVGAMTAQRTEVEKLIAALPGTLKLTFADKAQVQAAYDALLAYNNAKDETSVSTEVANSAILDAVVDKMATLEFAEVEKAFDLIKNDTAATVTIADKEAVLAAKAVFDAMDEGRNATASGDAEDGMYTWASSSIATTYDTLLADAYTTGSLYNAIRALELAVVEDAIDELNAESTAAEIAEVKALYDAFVAEYSSVEDNYNAANVVDDAAKLGALVEANKMTDKAAKAYVQDLSIKARSTKTAKGVKVTIKADVKELLDSGYTVEYKFYRSTKSNKGFKAMVTKTTGTYTNTKGVKGTKYYYKAKLVVKNAAGEVVATTPLTQCLYASRTF